MPPFVCYYTDLFPPPLSHIHSSRFMLHKMFKKTPSKREKKPGPSHHPKLTELNPGCADTLTPRPTSSSLPISLSGPLEQASKAFCNYTSVRTLPACLPACLRVFRTHLHRMLDASIPPNPPHPSSMTHTLPAQSPLPFLTNTHACSSNAYGSATAISSRKKKP